MGLAKLNKLLIFLFVACFPLAAQFSSTAYHIRYGANLPSVCTPNTGDVFFKTSPTSVYYCSASNTWSLLTSGGTPGSAAAVVSVAFSATPTFTCPSSSAGTVVDFSVATLTGNIGSSTLASCTAGSILNFIFTQDGTGGRTVTWPTGFSEAPQVNPIASTSTKVSFWWDGSNAHLIAATGTSGVGFGAETSAPSGNPASGFEFSWFDSTVHTNESKDSSGNVYSLVKTGADITTTTGTVTKINNISLAGLATGLLKNTTGTGVPSIAASSDVITLFSGCSGTLYLGADGACHSASGGGTPQTFYYQNNTTLNASTGLTWIVSATPQASTTSTLTGSATNLKFCNVAAGSGTATTLTATQAATTGSGHTWTYQLWFAATHTQGTTVTSAAAVSGFSCAISGTTNTTCTVTGQSQAYVAGDALCVVATADNASATSAVPLVVVQ